MRELVGAEEVEEGRDEVWDWERRVRLKEEVVVEAGCSKKKVVDVDWFVGCCLTVAVSRKRTRL